MNIGTSKLLTTAAIVCGIGRLLETQPERCLSKLNVGAIRQPHHARTSTHPICASQSSGITVSQTKGLRVEAQKKNSDLPNGGANRDVMLSARTTF